MELIILSKKCCRCKIEKNIDRFPKAPRSKYGVHSICKVCKQAYMIEYRLAGKLKISKTKYKNTLKGRETIRAYTASEQNKKIQRHYNSTSYGRASKTATLAKYRATQKRALPKWASLKDIKNVYKECPAGLEVDHIIPLHGDNVSGLHVPWNFQYLTRSENALKSNFFDGTMDNDSWRNRAA